MRVRRLEKRFRTRGTHTAGDTRNQSCSARRHLWNFHLPQTSIGVDPRGSEDNEPTNRLPSLSLGHPPSFPSSAFHNPAPPHSGCFTGEKQGVSCFLRFRKRNTHGGGIAMGQRIMALVPIARGFVRWLQHSGETSVNDPKVEGSGQRTQYSSYGQL
ncbi:hypothetical protein AVEN_65658-1 [Araneus ventricosus]|uniref:Uncharacterized protein n=1 Tax=Araneus ventricosus TaxID=182803 RepID=A0A4Y2RNP0_ARAVE|nr:hypothetical protein AVEN_65658-1 [Araneus ventricosus]